MSNVFYATYTVMYDGEEIIKEMLDTGEFEIPISDDQIAWFIRDQFIYENDEGYLDAGQPLDKTRENYITVGNGKDNLLFKRQSGVKRNA